MSKIDLTQLIKILNLTQSDSDGEALVAIRMVNSKMKAAGETWQSLIDPPSPSPKSYRFKEISDEFDRGWFNAVVECKEFTSLLDQGQIEWANSLIRYVNANNYVPQKHWDTLVKLWNQFRERTAR